MRLVEENSKPTQSKNDNRRSYGIPEIIWDLFFFFFDLGFMALSRIFHLYRADRSSKVGENRRTRRKTT